MGFRIEVITMLVLGGDTRNYPEYLRKVEFDRNIAVNLYMGQACGDMVSLSPTSSLTRSNNFLGGAP
jgi:hypothetical protein